MQSVFAEILDTDMRRTSQYSFHNASIMLDSCNRRAVGGIELLGWDGVDINWESDYEAIAKFLIDRTSGRFSFHKQMIKFEDSEDLIIFKLWFR